MKKLITLVCLVVLSPFVIANASNIITDKDRCIVAYKDGALAIKPLTDEGRGIVALEIEVFSSGEVAEGVTVYEYYARHGWDSIFKRTQGTLFTKYIVFDDHRGIAFYEEFPFLIEEINLSILYKGSYSNSPDTKLVCGAPHGRQRHGMYPRN